MLATLNPKQIVDEIVKDTVKDNDPHDAVQISPEIVLASRPESAAPALAPDIAPRPEPKFTPEPKLTLEPKPVPDFKIGPEPKFRAVAEPQPAAPSIDATMRVAAGRGPSPTKTSAAGKWLRGAFITFLFAGASAAATVVWEKHGDTARQMLAEWTPALASLWPSASQTAPVPAAQAAPPAEQDQTADQTAAQSAAAITSPAAVQPDAAQSVQSMTRDLAAMGQQIEQLKSEIAGLKAGQEQMARELTKPPTPKVTEAKPPVDPRARVSALPPRPAAQPVRKPKPAVTQTYMPAYSPAPLAPPPQAAAVPPPPPPAATTQAVADDNGPVVRPPMPLR